MFKLKTAPYSFQREAIEKLSRLKVGALYMDMGTGKTRAALELVQHRLEKGKVTHVLWLCPYSVMSSGDLVENLDKHADGWRPFITIRSIETLSASVRTNQELHELSRREKLFLVVDESLLVKNPYALRTRNITSIAALCEYKIILNGTPISKNMADLYSQWYLLDWRILGYRSYWSFAANHLEFDENHPGRVRRVLNVDYLTDKIAPYTYEIRKADCLSLPPKKHEKRYFNLTDEQIKHYDEVAERLMLDIDEIRPETIYRLFGALQAVTSGWVLDIDDNNYHYVKYPCFTNPLDNPRTQALLTSLDKFGGEKVIIYCRFTREIKEITSILNSRKSGSAIPFYGDLSDRVRKTNLELFRGNVQYFVANKSCARFGLNLQFCRNAVFYNNDWDYATREQAEDRIHRIGQERDVNIVDIIAAESIDETIQSSLARKSGLLWMCKENLKSKNMKSILFDMIHGRVTQDGENI